MFNYRMKIVKAFVVTQQKGNCTEVFEWKQRRRWACPPLTHLIKRLHSFHVTAITHPIQMHTRRD